jgi:hypothetical protein
MKNEFFNEETRILETLKFAHSECRKTLKKT